MSVVGLATEQLPSEMTPPSRPGCTKTPESSPPRDQGRRRGPQQPNPGNPGRCSRVSQPGPLQDPHLVPPRGTRALPDHPVNWATHREPGSAEERALALLGGLVDRLDGLEGKRHSKRAYASPGRIVLAVPNQLRHRPSLPWRRTLHFFQSPGPGCRVAGGAGSPLRRPARSAPRGGCGRELRPSGSSGQ